ncbi:MAG: hypothetical protein IAE90_01815 [Ignavibacteria bacterium]|nr:hypothetical protein [Ignavibacteria bacterium]
MLKFLKKLFNADVTIAPVVSVIEDEVNTFDTLDDAISGNENDPNKQNALEDKSADKDKE